MGHVSMIFGRAMTSGALGVGHRSPGFARYRLELERRGFQVSMPASRTPFDAARYASSRLPR
jgi:hypothetical protein